MTAGQQWTMNVPCNVQAASAARRAVRKTLADWGYEHACDDITLIVSELITNAVVHGAPDISCAISVSADLLIGEVVDHGSDLPHLINADDAAEHGRGLALVRAMTQSLGWCHTADGGKSVWFSYRLAEAS
jgi:Anti-sigma regulatory factor (Ser/Thr protein kinase)